MRRRAKPQQAGPRRQEPTSRRITTETKASYKTTELIAYVAWRT